jgi:hypothetical protein
LYSHPIIGWENFVNGSYKFINGKKNIFAEQCFSTKNKHQIKIMGNKKDAPKKKHLFY